MIKSFALMLSVLVAIDALPAQMTHESHGAADPSQPVLGAVDFPTSASEKSHVAFVRGVLYLHNFHYSQAANAFREAQHLDSSDVMGYWGEAMTYTHPVWNEQDTSAAHAALNRLAPTKDARLALARNEREREWLGAVEDLYQPGGSKAHRDTAYSNAMARVHASDTSDVEATTFYALSLLGLNQGEREPVAYRKAYELVAPVFLAHPRHPGAAHYLIHAVDDPDHAALGLKAAAAYSGIAPSAGHALHMTSHIFLALGKWDDVVDANLRAMATLPKGLLSGHSTHWIHYALIQQGRYHLADQWLDSIVKQARAGPERLREDSWYAASAMSAANIIDTHRWDGVAMRIHVDTAVANLPTHTDDDLDLLGSQFAYALGALNTGDHAAFDKLLTRIAAENAAHASAPAGTLLGGILDVMEKTLRGYSEWKAGSLDSALGLFRKAADEEASLPMPFGPPIAIKPPRESAGELLLAMKRPAEAKGEFQMALTRTPGRVAPLLGLARSEAALGNHTESRKRYAQVLAIWHMADRDLPELAEVRAGSR
jgi:hypothetical protein